MVNRVERNELESYTVQCGTCSRAGAQLSCQHNKHRPAAPRLLPAKGSAGDVLLQHKGRHPAAQRCDEFVRRQLPAGGERAFVALTIFLCAADKHKSCLHYRET